MFQKIAYLLFWGCFCLGTFSVVAQDQPVADSLFIIYQKKTLTGTAKLELLTDLSFNETKDLNKGLKFAEELIAISQQSGQNAYLRLGYFLKGTKKKTAWEPG